MLQENYIPKQIFGHVSKPVLENWLEGLKGPKATLEGAIDTSSEILKEYLICRDLWIKQIMLYN